MFPAVASASTHKPGSRTLRHGMSGTAVRALQHELTQVGFRTSATGRYDAATTRTVSRVQRRYGLRATGVATPRFIRTLASSFVNLTWRIGSHPKVSIKRSIRIWISYVK